MSSRSQEILESNIRHKGILPIIRSDSRDKAIEQIEIVARAGYRIAEVSATTPGWNDVVAHATSEYPNISIGAGTVMTATHAELAREAGAKFLLSPGIPKEIAEILRMQLPFIPGVMTPTDVGCASELGLMLMKLYPASTLGVGYLRQLQAPFPEVSFLAVGGLTEQDAAAWIGAGAVGIGIGNALTCSLLSEGEKA